MKYYYKGAIYEMYDYQDDTEKNEDNDELVKLGLIFGQPTVNGNGIEVEYNAVSVDCWLSEYQT